jgi:four helix bundle protein
MSQCADVRPAGEYLQKALEAASNAAGRYPGCGRLWFKRGRIADRLDLKETAAESYRKAIYAEDAYREQFRIMYPGREMFSRLGEANYRFARQRLQEGRQRRRGLRTEDGGRKAAKGGEDSRQRASQALWTFGKEETVMAKRIDSFKDLDVYNIAFRVQQEIFELTNQFPKEETFSLTNQIRRSSRSIGANISEAWQKRRYPAHFVSKLSDADGEQAETQHWLGTVVACNYAKDNECKGLINTCTRIGKMLGKMMAEPGKWCGRYGE